MPGLISADPLSIAVVNTTEDRTGEYIGRKFAGNEQSPLHNPFVLPKGATQKQRTRVIQQFKRHLLEAIARVAEGGGSTEDWMICQELDRLLAIARKGKLKLRCWCKPKDCHGDVIAEVLIEAIETGQIFCPDIQGFRTPEEKENHRNNGSSFPAESRDAEADQGISRGIHRYGSCTHCGEAIEIPGLEQAKCVKCGWKTVKVWRSFEVLKR